MEMPQANESPRHLRTTAFDLPATQHNHNAKSVKSINRRQNSE